VVQGRQDAAQNGLQRLVKDHAAHGYLPYVLREIAGQYLQGRRHEEAKSLCQYVLDNFSDSDQCLWAQRDLVLSDLALRDLPAAQVGTDALLKRSSGRMDALWAVSEVAETYSRIGQHEQARELFRFNLTGNPNLDDTIWSLRGFINESIALKDEAAIDAGVKTLMSEFAGSRNLPMAAVHVGRELSIVGHKHAADVLQHVIDKHPEDEQTLLARVCMGYAYIMQGKDGEAETLYSQIMTQYANHPNLAEVVHAMAEGYFDCGKAAERDQMRRVGFQAYTNEVIIQGRPDAMKRYYQQAARKWELVITRFPDAPIVPRAYELAATCYEYANDYKKALEYFTVILDLYPGYESADRAQFMVGRMCKRLRDQGVMTDTETMPIILAASKAIIDQYPQSSFVIAAQNVVDRTIETEGRENKESMNDQEQ